VAATYHYFMLPKDEQAFFRVLARERFTVYPEYVPAGYNAPAVTDALVAELDQSAYYLAVERLGPVIVHPMKRGPEKGLFVIEEVPSPVLHYERSLTSERGELVAGRLWAELDVTDDPNARYGKHRGLRAIFEEVGAFLKKSFRRSEPKGYFVGPAAARAWKTEGLVLRAAGHKGRSIGVWG
jgi:hypothetical protein